MKRSFVYLVLALMLSLLLSACGDMTDHGNVAASPWPDVTEPVMPIPSTPVSATPIPEYGTGTGNNFESGTDMTPDPGMDSGTGTGSMSTSSPRPTDTDR